MKKRHLLFALIGSLFWPSPHALAQKKSAARAMECINAEHSGDDVRLHNRCPEAVNVSFCVRGNLRSAWSCPSRAGTNSIDGGSFANAKGAARESGNLVWGACFAPQSPAGFSGVGQFTCR